MQRPGLITRTDDITKVKGVVLAPTAIEEPVRSFSELGDRYEAAMSKKGDVNMR